MQKIYTYMVDGNAVEVPENELDEFLEWATLNDKTADQVNAFSVDGEMVSVPDSEIEEFSAWAKANGKDPQESHSIEMDDGNLLDITDNNLKNFVQARRDGMPITRKMLPQFGIPDWYGKGESERMALADKLGNTFMPENRDERAGRIERIVGEYGGNIEHTGRPMLMNRDENGKINGYSTTESTVVQDEDGSYVVVPTDVIDKNGESIRLGDNAKAKEWYLQTGENYGKFKTKAQAQDAAQNVHELHQNLYQKDWNDYIHNNWDEMSDEIRNAPGVAAEHERRTAASLKSKMDFVDGTDKQTTEEAMPSNMGILPLDPTNLDGALPPEQVLNKTEGALDYLKTSKEAEYGKELGGLESVAANLPFVGSVMDSNEKRKESVEKRLYNGEFRDSLEASKLALSIGVPQEEVRRVNEQANGDEDAMRKGFSDLVSEQLAKRIEVRQKKGERLSQNDLGILQKVGVGAVGLGKTVAEMSNPVTASATMGPSMMNRAANMEQGQWTLGPDGKPVEVMPGDSGDKAMLKGLAGSAAERAIWMNKLPGMGKVAEKLGKGFVGRNTSQLLEMTLKNDFTDFVDNVMGMNLSDMEKKKKISDWAEQHFLPQNLMMDMLEAMPAHFGMKAVRLLTPNGREAWKQELRAAADEKAAKEEKKINDLIEERTKRENARKEAQERYDNGLGEEAGWNIDKTAEEIVGTDPELKLKVIQRATEIAKGRGELEDPVRQREIVEQAAKEVGDAITKTEQKDAGDKNAAKIANDIDVAEKRQVKQEEIESAFNEQYGAWLKERESAQKKGEPFTKPMPTRKSVTEQIDREVSRKFDNYTDEESANVFLLGSKDPSAEQIDSAIKDVERRLLNVAGTSSPMRQLYVKAIRGLSALRKEKAYPQPENGSPKTEKTNEQVIKDSATEKLKAEAPVVEKQITEAPIVEKPTAEAPKETPASDQAFRNWLKSGRPIEDMTPEQEAESRKVFDMMVKAGKVDPTTGEIKFDLPEVQEPTAKDEPRKPVETTETKPEPVAVPEEPKAQNAPNEALIAASKVLKEDAYLPDKDLQRKLIGWKRNVNSLAGERKAKLQAQIDAAETILAERNKGTEVETPAEPVEPIVTQSQKVSQTETTAPAKQPTALANATEQAKTDAANRLAKMETADLQDTRASLIAANETEPSKKIGKQIADIEAELNRRGEPLAMIDDTSMDSKLTDPDFIAWANKSARTPSDSARRTYDAQQVDAIIAQTKNWAGNVKVVKHDTHAEVPDGARQIYSKDGNVVGYFDKGTKQIHLLPNADAKTVAHELGWHATYDYAEQLAAGGDRRLLDKMNDYANGANNIVIDPATGQTLASSITGRYGANGVTDPRAILDEIGAGRYTMDNVAKIKDAAARRQAAGFFERASTAIRDGVKSMLAKMGFNKVDLTGIDAMTPEQAMGFLSDQMLKGKRLGKLKDATPQIDMHSKAKASSRYVTTMKDHLRPIDEIEKEAGKTTDSSAYTDMRLLPGKVQKVINEAETFSKEIGDYCKKNRISIDELNEYMYAKAAEQRNATIMARNGRADGSAMSDADIQRIKAAYAADPAKERMLETARQKVLDFQRKGFHERVRSGLISAQDAANMEAAEPDHVPMRSRFNKDGDFEGFNGNEGFANREFRTAKGRTNLADGPLGWILQEYVDAYSRGAENEARQKLLSTVIANPEVGSVRQLRPGESVNEIRRKGQSGDANVFAVKANGNTYEVKLNGERGERIVAALTGRDMKSVAKALQGGMRIYSSAATAWSPTFAARNLIADTIDVGAVNIGEHGFAKGTVKNVQHIGNAVKHVKGIREYIKTGKTNDAVVQEAIDAGVLMGGGAKTRAWTGGEADANNALNTIRTDLKKGMSGARAVGKFLGGWVDNLNQTAEMMNRVADYEMQRKDGATKKEAALHAREITVDFNQKGTLTPWLNTAYMFSNAALGSSVRLAKAIAVNPKTGKVNWKNGGQLVCASVLTGVIEAALEHAMNGDDEEGKNVNEYTRFNSFAVRKGKNVIRVPVHPSPLSLAKYGGNLAYRYATGQLKKGDAGYNFGKETMDVIAPFLGVGSMGDNLEATMIPTLAQPFYQHWNNTDYAGRPIKKRTFDDVTPESHNGRNSTPEMYKALAEWMNDVTGGNEARKGKIDVAPEILQHYAKSLGKNVLTDITQTADAIYNIVKGIKGEKTEWDRRNIPVVKDYLRRAPDNTDRYFKAHDAYEADLNEWNKRKGKMSAQERADYSAKHPWVKREKYVNRLTNGYAMESGVHAYGINDYRKLISGKRRLSNGNWVEAKNQPTDEQIESWTKKMIALQAKMLAVMGR